MREINVSIGVDKRLWREDIAASRAHVTMLAAKGIVSAEDGEAILEGLDRIASEYERRACRRTRRSKTSTCMSSTG
jgi:argininosuccinate lyase